MKLIRKRDGRLVEFDQERITNAIQRAFNAVGEVGDVQKLSDEVTKTLSEKYGEDGVPMVEEIQDLVENTIMKAGYFEVARAYILYRKQRQQVRELAFLLESADITEGYLNEMDWYVKENANMKFSLQGLNNYLSSKIISQYWLMRIYTPRIRKAHIGGAIHLHDLPSLSAYCVGWDIRELLMNGFRGVAGKVESTPARHFRSALGQVVNFFYTMQGESAGAQAFSNFDTYLAPFIREDDLNYEQVLQSVQEFIFNMNVSTRVGFQTPFSNLTFDITIPEFMKDEAVIVGGKMLDYAYGDLEEEMKMFNKAYIQIMYNGDAVGRIFTFPIVTYNITKDFDWNFEELFKLTAKYGSPYFSNFINSNMKPEDVRSMCCRLRIDNKSLLSKGGGYFGASPLTGSIGVVTVNLSQIGYLAKDEGQFFEKLEEIMEIAKESLELKRKAIERFTELGLYPYSKIYLGKIKQSFGRYWANHFSTIGIIAMNEALLNMFGLDISSEEGVEFAIKTLQFIKKKILEFQEQTGNLYNLEATPAEGASYRLALIDKKNYPNIKTAGEDGEPFYTNSTLLPVDFSGSFFEALEHQNKLQPLYTGGTVFHVYLGESNSNWVSLANIINKIASKTNLPYFTITPTFSVCSTHGYFAGKKEKCPNCGKDCEVYSRVVGYFRPVSQWNKGKQEEFRLRKTYDNTVS
jgi:ribonucleoside-triphosphate reductase